MDYTPSPTAAINRTEEQQMIVDASLNRDKYPVIIVQAGAGTGKTFTLKDVATELKPRRERVLYLVFNKKNRVEAASKFRGLAKVSTVNGFAFQQMRVADLGRNVVSGLYPKQIAQILGLKSKICGVYSFQAAKLIKQTLAAFCVSADANVLANHMAPSLSRGKNQDLAAAILRYTQALFDMLRPGMATQHPITHDIYTKAFQLEGCPGIRSYDFVMIDEAQDSPDVTIAILRHATTLLMVGDDHQAIYTFRDCKNAMRAFNGHTLTLTQSFRFGPAVAELANAIVYQKRIKPSFPPLKGWKGIQSTIGTVGRGVNHTRLYRSNVELILDALYFTDNNLPICIIGDLTDLQSKLSSGWDLFQGNNNRSSYRHPLLAQYRGWGDFEKAVHITRDIELKQVYKIITDYTSRIPELIGLLGKEWNANAARITLVSGHRSKGLEFEHVVIGHDFDKQLDLARGNAAWDDELNLLYVAVTRGRQVVEPQCQFIQKLAKRLGLM